MVAVLTTHWAQAKMLTPAAARIVVSTPFSFTITIQFVFMHIPNFLFNTNKSDMGKMLRVNVSSNWASPPDNPCVLNAACFGSIDGTTPKEIWAIGLRNPWRFSFDRATGDMFIADVG